MAAWLCWCKEWDGVMGALLVTMLRAPAPGWVASGDGAVMGVDGTGLAWGGGAASFRLRLFDDVAAVLVPPSAG